MVVCERESHPHHWSTTTVCLKRSIFVLLLLTGLTVLLADSAYAQETIIVSDDSSMMLETEGVTDSCGCQNTRRPPWHGNVHGSCNPCCDPHTRVFHADPYGQLRMKNYARKHCLRMPSHFPRFQTWVCEGYLPYPPPPVQPRCGHCGAVIEGGF